MIDAPESPTQPSPSPEIPSEPAPKPEIPEAEPGKDPEAPKPEIPREAPNKPDEAEPPHEPDAPRQPQIKTRARIAKPPKHLDRGDYA